MGDVVLLDPEKTPNAAAWLERVRAEHSDATGIFMIVIKEDNSGRIGSTIDCFHMNEIDITWAAAKAADYAQLIRCSYDDEEF